MRTRITTLFACLLPALAVAQTDPLPSWNHSDAKHAIISFVQDVTTQDSPHFVPATERIAVFDNDGTLWAEQPIYFQLAFAIDRIKALAPQHPEWRTTPPFADLLRGDVDSALSGGEQAIAKILAASHTGMTTDDFQKIVKDWTRTARHPKFNRLYTDCVYQPMLELLSYLRDNDFKTYIVSGGGVEFMRPWVEAVYGIPPEQVIGSMGRLKLEFRNDKPVLVKLPEVDFIDDKAGKPVGIQKFIGRKPIFAFGNSDGDLEMLQWTASSDKRHFLGLIHHTDAVREWAYDRDSSVGRLDKALDAARSQGWTVLNMKEGWNKVFPE